MVRTLANASHNEQPEPLAVRGAGGVEPWVVSLNLGWTVGVASLVAIAYVTVQIVVAGCAVTAAWWFPSPSSSQSSRDVEDDQRLAEDDE